MALTGLAIIVVALALTYYLLLSHYLKSWDQIPQVPDSNVPVSRLSVVIAARNEARNIEGCLTSISEQDLPGEHYEVIVVDDHSNDTTTTQVGKFPGVRLVALGGRQNDGHGKKAALTRGIQEATGDIIVTTDADCIVGPGWLEMIARSFNSDVEAVTGPVCYAGTPGFLHNFQALEVLGLMIVTGGGLASGMHRLGNGANMAFRKRTFEQLGGYTGNEHLASGDDLFLLEKLVEAYPGSVHYVKSPAAVVRTYPQNSWSGLVQQRLRWATKNTALKDWSIQAVWGGIWLVHFMLLIALLAFPVMSLTAKLIVAIALLVKVIADYRILSTAVSFTGSEGAMRWFAPSFAINFVYILYIGLASLLTNRYEWKGRSTN